MLYMVDMHQGYVKYPLHLFRVLDLDYNSAP